VSIELMKWMTLLSDLGGAKGAGSANRYCSREGTRAATVVFQDSLIIHLNMQKGVQEDMEEQKWADQALRNLMSRQ